jgi:hypothetical protein
MAKYEFKIEIKPREDEDTGQGPSLEEIDGVLTAALLAAFPDAAEIRVYDGNRPDRD